MASGVVAHGREQHDVLLAALEPIDGAHLDVARKLGSALWAEHRRETGSVARVGGQQARQERDLRGVGCDDAYGSCTQGWVSQQKVFDEATDDARLGVVNAAAVLDAF